METTTKEIDALEEKRATRTRSSSKIARTSNEDSDEDEVVFLYETQGPVLNIPGHDPIPERAPLLANKRLHSQVLRSKKKRKSKQAALSPKPKRKKKTESTANSSTESAAASPFSSIIAPASSPGSSASAASSSGHVEYRECMRFVSPNRSTDGCKEFSPRSDNAMTCANCNHHRSYHKRVDVAEPQSPMATQSPLAHSPPLNPPVASPVSPERSQDLQNSSAQIRSLPTATPPTSPFSCSDEDNDSPPHDFDADSNNNNNKLEDSSMPDISDEEEQETEKITNQQPQYYPLLPSAICPIDLYEQLRKLPFEHKIILETLVSTEDLKWNHFKDAEYLNRILDAKSVIDLLKVLQDKTQRNMAVLERLAKKQDKWNGKQLLALNAKVLLDKIVFEGPFEEQSNRVFREFGSDRFLRVSFEARGKHSEKSIRQVYHAVLQNGIRFAGRNYEFLGFSASQLREHKCCFFASSGDGITDGVTATHVRQWLGDFSDIKSVGKYGARLGQAFSKTDATITVPDADIEDIDDIMLNDYNFTDGCGEISPEYAAKVSEALGLKEGYVPSAFQIRFGPCKGVLVVNPKIHNKIRFRPSMKKYRIPNPSASQRTIEVIKVARPLRGYLNRQFILLLDALGIPQEYFLTLQESAIADLLSMSRTTYAALQHLRKDDRIDSMQSIAFAMLLAGHTADEPYLHSLLLNIQKTQLNQLKSKSRIYVPKSRVLLGVCDPIGKLESGQVFVQYSTIDGETHVLERLVAVSKNPCLHPGDFRLLEAVDIPELNYLRDVIVFPTKGPRPHQDEIAGGDLDGDQFFVTWDRDLIKFKPYPPMNYKNTDPPIEIKGDPIPALHKFFIDYIFTSSLGIIANFHTIHSDKHKASDEISLQLAELHSKAVDSPKTGALVTIPSVIQELIGHKYPHFMEETAHETYHSTGVLGALYDQVLDHLNKLNSKDAEKTFQPDERLLLPGREKYMTEARKQLKRYNREMSNALKLPDADQQQHAISQIRQRHRQEFKANAAYGTPILLKASAWYAAAYENAMSSTYPNIWNTVPPLSFPWNVCDRELNRIRCDSVEEAETALTVAHDMIPHLRLSRHY